MNPADMHSAPAVRQNSDPFLKQQLNAGRWIEENLPRVAQASRDPRKEIL
jgi:hypothetical protein